LKPQEGVLVEPYAEQNLVWKGTNIEKTLEGRFPWERYRIHGFIKGVGGGGKSASFFQIRKDEGV